MLRIRLSRVGRKHDPSYRVIVTEKGRGPQTGNYVEQVGTYDARSDKHELKGERITYWIDNGAQPSDTVHNLLLSAGIIEGETVNPLPKKSPIVSDEPEEDEAEAEEAGEAEDASDDDSAEEENGEDAADEDGDAESADEPEDDENDSEDDEEEKQEE